MTVAKKIKEIEDRLNSITSPKWKYEYEGGCHDHYILTEDGKYIAQTTYDDLSTSKEHNVMKDSEFIAHAPEDIKFLLDLVKSGGY